MQKNVMQMSKCIRLQIQCFEVLWKELNQQYAPVITICVKRIKNFL